MEEDVRQAWEQHVLTGEPDECWEWTGTRSPAGYGSFYLAGTVRSAHRAALEMKLGRPIAEGLFACHACDTPWCVNPSHLWEGSAKDNVDDMWRKGRARTRIPTTVSERNSDTSSDPPIPSKDELPELMTTEEVSVWLRVSPRTIRDWARAEQIPAVPLPGPWRFSRDALLKWMSDRGSGE